MGREACGCRCAQGCPQCTTPRNRSSLDVHGRGIPDRIEFNVSLKSSFEVDLGLGLLNVWVVSSQVSGPEGCSEGVHLGKEIGIED